MKAILIIKPVSSLLDFLPVSIKVFIQVLGGVCECGTECISGVGEGCIISVLQQVSPLFQEDIDAMVNLPSRHLKVVKYNGYTDR
jgi:hypothetical protein